MLKFFILLFACAVTLFSQSIIYGVSDKHAFVLPKGKLQIKTAYLRVNDTLDVFNLKEKELGKYAKLGSIGDMDGVDFELRYGVRKDDSLFFNYQRWNIDYTGATLKNNKFNIFNRYNVISNKYSFFNAFSFDVGFTRNSSSPLNIKNDKFLNLMIKKIRPGTDKSIKDGAIVAGDTALTFYDKNGKKIYPYLSIENLESNSYYIRLLLGKKITQHSVIDFYTGYKITDIKTRIAFHPNSNSSLNSILSKYKMPNLDRKEKSANLGFEYSLELGSYIMEFNYEYNKIFRDDDVSYVDDSNIVNASISKVINKNLLVYLGGRLMVEQFNTDIPYLYNKYTKTQFDKKYGFAKFGVLFSF